MARTLEVGTIVADRYKLIERLGGGGMGEVYRAENVLAGRIVAIKLLRADFAENEDLTRRFFQEAQAANKIRHPNIVDVIDAGFSSIGPYVVMECLEGTSVAHALSRLGKLDVATALAVILPTLSALDAAHRQGIVHRDLKPENIFVAEINGEVRVKLLDFGIAKVQDTTPGGAAPRTSTGVIFGTPDYLSPEQANGDGDVDGRSDIFAVGTVLFELITGRRPFEAPTAVATAYKIVHSPAPTLAVMGFDVPARIQATLDTALSKEKADRFASAADFADSLAPVTPHGAVRRQALATLLQTVLAHQPTQAAPKRPAPPEPTFEPSLPGVVLPPPSWDNVPSPPKREIKPVGPTLVSQGYGQSPSIEPKPAVVREVVPSPAPPAAPNPARISSPAISARLGSDPGRMTPVSAPTPSPRSSAPRTRAGAWTPRPLPASARGRCHVRGTLPRAVTRWLTREHGDRKRDEVLTVLPTELADMARTDAFNALVWYDLEAVDTFIEAATLVAQDGDPGSWRALAKNNFDRDLGSIFRPAVRTVDAPTLLKRIPAVWSRIFDFGVARTEQTSPRKVLVRISGFEPASLSIRNIMVGTFEGMLAPTPGLAVRILAGEASFSRDFEIEFGW